MLETTKGKEHALKALAKRKKEAKKVEQIDNGSLPAGAFMYYYCISCGLIADVLPETHLNVPKQLCNECQALKDLGWLEE